eukprot:TRINITY_DN293_c0_g1_i1.p1 TRINITY_DN293_c0_g1~~TRINITY_DN293_c0_g1_i1.p1  ORF type:complete len:505 (-),score=126.91 TRINITY_DN293_c0_g1_i1:519-2033(-)
MNNKENLLTMEPPNIALTSPNKGGTISEADMLACLNSPPGSALAPSGDLGKSLSKPAPPRISTNSLTTGSPIGSGRGLTSNALGSPINLQTPGHNTSLTSPQEDLELELSLRGRLIVDQQRRIVELESELAHAQAEITKLKEKVEEFKNANKKEEEKKPQSRYWTPEEHDRFLDGLEKFGAKDVKSISAYVGSRNATQVRTHAQKYYLRLMRETEREKALKEGGVAPAGVKRQAVYMRSPNKKKKQKTGESQASDSDADLKKLESERPGATEKKWQPSEYVLLDKGLKEFSNEHDMKVVYKRISEIFLPKRTPEEVAELHKYYQTKVCKDPGDSVHNLAASGTVNQRTRRTQRKPPAGLNKNEPPNTPGFGNTSPTALLTGGANIPSAPTSPGQQAPLLTVPLSPPVGGPLTPLASPGDPLSPSFLDSFSNQGGALSGDSASKQQGDKVLDQVSPSRTRRNKDSKNGDPDVAKPLDFSNDADSKKEVSTDSTPSMRRSTRRNKN